MDPTGSVISREQWNELERVIRFDPSGRGLAGHVENDALLGAGMLAEAAADLARHGTSVAIVTGFCIVDAPRPAAETDGPPGALYLARALASLGVNVQLITDRYGLPLVEAGCDRLGIDRRSVHCFPFEPGGPDDLPRRLSTETYHAVSDQWIDEFLRHDGARLSHLISIERAGPNHTLESIRAQRHDDESFRQFEQEVPSDARDLCHNMRGIAIHGYVAKTHRLFEAVKRRGLPVRTIGIGDGGNELGMGYFRWETVRRAVRRGPGGRTACRVAADYAILAGVSNWGGYALALAVCRLRGRGELAAGWTAAAQRDLIETIVRQTDAVDGMTLRREASVDGVQIDDYMRQLAAIRSVLGWTD